MTKSKEDFVKQMVADDKARAECRHEYVVFHHECALCGGEATIAQLIDIKNLRSDLSRYRAALERIAQCELPGPGRCHFSREAREALEGR